MFSVLPNRLFLNGLVDNNQCKLQLKVNMKVHIEYSNISSKNRLYLRNTLLMSTYYVTCAYLFCFVLKSVVKPSLLRKI